MKRINEEHIIGILCIALGTVVLLLTRSFPTGAASSMQLTGPAFFPNVLAALLILLGGGEIAKGVARSMQPSDGEKLSGFIRDLKNPGTVTIYLIIGMLIFYTVALKRLGFFTTSALFLIIILRRFRIVWWKNLLVTTVLLALIFLIFVEIFSTRLPSGILF